MTIRKLASIRKVAEIKSIPNADSICAYRVDGWWVVDSIGKYAVGDFVIYCEPDSWIPTALAPFLTKGDALPREYDGVKGERLRTVRLKGQISQGLVLPTSFVTGEDAIAYELSEGQDVTEALGILKYEPPISAQLAGVVKGLWPSSVPKTDEERIQNLTNEWDALRQETYEVTEKLEGASMTVGIVDNEFIVCSRNVNLAETKDNTLWEVARRYEIENKMRTLALYEVVIQGELIGEGIEGNHYGIKGQDFYVYTVYDIVAGKYLSPDKRNNICRIMSLKHVPVIGEAIPLHVHFKTIDEVLAFSDGQSQINPAKHREGLVYKQVDGQAHFKAVSNSYLLKHGTR